MLIFIFFKRRSDGKPLSKSKANDALDRSAVAHTDATPRQTCVAYQFLQMMTLTAAHSRITYAIFIRILATLSEREFAQLAALDRPRKRLIDGRSGC
jgi:alpha-ketoglutarate-dependent taurine dioxygenase